MTETPGLSFSPLGADPTKRPAGERPNQPIQEAIRVLSLRVPQMRGGAPSLAPNALLQAPGSGGIASPMGGGQTNLGLEQLLRRLFGMPATGAFAPPVAAPPSAPPMAAPALAVGGWGGSAAPAPSITPGVDYATQTQAPQMAPPLPPAAPAAPAPPFVGGGSPLGGRLGDKYGV